MLKTNRIKVLTLIFGLFQWISLQASETTEEKHLAPFWQNAVVYFAMTDRFYNGDTMNDMPSPRKDDGTLLRGFHGGDIRGLIDKIKSGYFKDLGVQVLWMTPLIENIHGPWIDEWGTTYGYHGYWAKDWTKVDPNFGTEADMQELIEIAHQHKMRVMLDVVINHVGPHTAIDPVWPKSWVRRSPTCDYKSFAGVANCNMVPSLPDVITENQTPVKLPDFLIKKWKSEGRLEQEMLELDEFFNRSGYPKTPQHHIIKWLTDWVREYGADGFRVDTAKHVEAAVWQQLKDQAVVALADWRSRNPQRHNDDLPFYMVGEVMEWGMLGFQRATDEGRSFDFGDMQVDFFDYGFDALINMGFATHANQPINTMFNAYAQQLNHGPLQGKGIINYVTSHDDMGPFDRDRTRTYESATKLMLAPGAVQITFGDELARNLTVPEAIGDEWLRTPVDWSPANMLDKQAILQHWQKLGQFRAAHLAVGAGEHKQITGEHYVFSRILQRGNIHDAVVIALDLPNGEKELPVGGAFKNSTIIKDYYSGQILKVTDGMVKINNDNQLVLLAQP